MCVCAGRDWGGGVLGVPSVVTAGVSLMEGRKKALIARLSEIPPQSFPLITSFVSFQAQTARGGGGGVGGGGGGRKEQRGWWWGATARAQLHFFS